MRITGRSFHRNSRWRKYSFDREISIVCMRILKIPDYSFEYISKIFILGFTLNCFHGVSFQSLLGIGPWLMDSDAIGLQKIVLKLLRWRPDHPDMPMGLM